MCNGSTLHRGAEPRSNGRILPLMHGKLLVLPGTNARRDASLPGGILLKLSITYRELAVISRHMCTLSSEERSSRLLSFSLSYRDASHPLNLCIKPLLLYRDMFLPQGDNSAASCSPSPRSGRAAGKINILPRIAWKSTHEFAILTTKVLKVGALNEKIYIT